MVAAAAMLLLIPLVAMQFTTEVNWSPFDFLLMGILLLGVIILIEVVMRLFKTSLHRIIFVAAVLLFFLLVWAELAVGIFGTPFAGS